jgi:hypothetical protein
MTSDHFPTVKYHFSCFLFESEVHFVHGLGCSVWKERSVHGVGTDDIVAGVNLAVGYVTYALRVENRERLIDLLYTGGWSDVASRGKRDFDVGLACADS